MSGLCPRIDYRPQWGNDGKAPIHLGCHYTTQPLKRQCLVRQALRLGSGQAHHRRFDRPFGCARHRYSGQGRKRGWPRPGQVAQVLHPTPTILPDPITVVHEVKSLARLETIQYSVEKIVTAETGQAFLSVLFGDRLLFVAHGVVIAGVDLAQFTAGDVYIEDGILFVQLPEPEIFVATLDNEKSYIYDRQIGFLRRGDVALETAARKVAEEEIEKAAISDGILEQAEQNAELFLMRMFTQLGFPEVVFTEKE